MVDFSTFEFQTILMNFRKAALHELPEIWTILQFAIEQRRLDGSDQWQDGYPNEESIKTDISNNHAYVIEENGSILLYGAIIFGADPAYVDIDGAWLNDDAYVVLHRVAISKDGKGRGLAMQFFKEVETLSKANNIHNIRVDTNFDNIPMLKLMDRLQYSYCGEVQMRGGTRKAFQKVL